MKKIIAVMLAAFMLVSLCGCDFISNLLEPGSEELVGTEWILWSVETDGDRLDYNAINAVNEANDDVDYSGKFEFTDVYEANMELMGVTAQISYKLLDDQLTITDGETEFVTAIEDGRFTINAGELPNVEKDMVLEFALDDGTLMQELAGELAGTEWVMYSLSALGITLQHHHLEMFGLSGTLSFADDASYELDALMGDMGENVEEEGMYTCLEGMAGAVLYSEGEGVVASIEDGILTVTVESTDENGISGEICFVQEGSELLDMMPETTFDESYSGDLANTVWPLYYIEEDGMRYDGVLIEMVGASGSLTFGEGTYVLDLAGEVFEGTYVVDGSTVILQVMGIDALAFERDNGVLILDVDGAGTVMAFGYDTELN